MRALLSFQEVFFSWDADPLIAAFSEEFFPGERRVLQGPSGCGKTTWLLLASGLLTPQRGSVTHRPEITYAMAFQDQALWPHLTALEHLTLVLKSLIPDRSSRQQRAHEGLAEVGLENLANRRPEDLSGGERQRLSLIRALVTEPDILLLDEPFNHLDNERSRQLGQMIAHRPGHQEKLTLCATHDDPALLEAVLFEGFKGI